MLNFILLQAEMAAEGQGQNQWSFWIMMILIFVVFYFFMIRDQGSTRDHFHHHYR